MNRITLALASVALATSAFAAKPADHTKDEEGIKATFAAFADAWNKHDAKAMVATFTDDGSLLDPFHPVAKGQAEVEKVFTELHATMAKNSSTVAFTANNYDWVKPDVVAIDAVHEVAGMIGPDGKTMPPTKFNVAMLAAKKGGKWLARWVRVNMAPPPPPPVAASPANAPAKAPAKATGTPTKK